MSLGSVSKFTMFKCDTLHRDLSTNNSAIWHRWMNWLKICDRTSWSIRIFDFTFQRAVPQWDFWWSRRTHLAEAAHRCGRCYCWWNTQTSLAFHRWGRPCGRLTGGATIGQNTATVSTFEQQYHSAFKDAHTFIQRLLEHHPFSRPTVNSFSLNPYCSSRRFFKIEKFLIEANNRCEFY